MPIGNMTTGAGSTKLAGIKGAHGLADEVIALLAAKAPRLDRALKKVARGGGEVVLLDGALIRTRRHTGKSNRKNYSGKHKSHTTAHQQHDNPRTLPRQDPDQHVQVGSGSVGALDRLATAALPCMCSRM
ncbi:hypothetical protein AB0B92_13010 [Streptomyces hygroscopicus]|uniref:hypothetical protein n=1 Tax=Streptomyces hygroscopicus TaxID=1912 RepID=UPI0033F2E700